MNLLSHVVELLPRKLIGPFVLLAMAVALSNGICTAYGQATVPVNVRGLVVDAESGEALPARVHIQDENGKWFFAESVAGEAVRYERLRDSMPQSPEVHTTLSAGPFTASLSKGKYTIRVERGKEYLPVVKQITVADEPLKVQFKLRRWIDMAERGWYSGDTHVHRKLDELPNVLLAEDLNVALPLTYWVTDANSLPADGKGSTEKISPELIKVTTRMLFTQSTPNTKFFVLVSGAILWERCLC